VRAPERVGGPGGTWTCRNLSPARFPLLARCHRAGEHFTLENFGPPPAPPSPPEVRGQTFAKGSASGYIAQVVVSGRTEHPEAIYLRVKSQPPQPVSGFWSVVCTRDHGGAGTTRRNVGGRAPVVRRLRLPFAHPSACSVTGSISLTASPGGIGTATGSLEVRLL